MLTRTANPKTLLALLSRYTGKAYKRNQSADGLKDVSQILEAIK